MRVGLVTGASQGLGLALAGALVEKGWSLVIDGRDPAALADAASQLSGGAKVGALPGDEAGRLSAGAELGAAAAEGTSRRDSGATVRAVAGDVADPAHRRALFAAVGELGRLDLLVNNASILGPSPQPPLGEYPLEVLERVYQVNVLAPLALIQLALPFLRATQGRIIDVTSDAAVEAYPGWGGYGSSKAALEQLTAVLAAEEPGMRIYRVDPGDLRTRLHQEAFPGEDISDRPLPEVAVPGLLVLTEGDEPSGRYRAQELVRS